MQQTDLKRRLDQLLMATVPQLNNKWELGELVRTRTKNKAEAKWFVEATLGNRTLTIKSLVPARDLVKSRNDIVVIHSEKGEVWVGYEPVLEGLISQLQHTVLWTPAVEKAISKALADHKKQQRPEGG